jgi:hypothetical protein
VPYRQSLVKADVTIGPHHLGIADSWGGGSGGADTGTYRRASGEVALGGNKTRENGTVRFLCDEAFWAVWPDLDRNRGEYPARVVLTPTGDDGTPFASGSITLVGRLVDVPTPQGDYSSNEANSIELGLQLDAERA